MSEPVCPCETCDKRVMHYQLRLYCPKETACDALEEFLIESEQALDGLESKN